MDEMSVIMATLFHPVKSKQFILAEAWVNLIKQSIVVSPAQGLAEASLSISGVTNSILLGNNTSWQQQTFTFIATGTTTPLVITGVEPGILVDSLSVAANGGLGDSLQFNTVSNAIVDHVSASWSTNAEMSVLASTNVTVQWSIMADSLYSTNYPQGSGSTIRQGGGMVSFNHNLYADNYSGSPRLGDNVSLDFVNNVIYNWGVRSGMTDGTNDLSDFSINGYTNQLNYVCNYLIAGPDTAAFSANNYDITNICLLWWCDQRDGVNLDFFKRTTLLTVT